MKFRGFKDFNLVPVGKVRFSFKKRKGFIWIGEINILHDTDINIDNETYNMIMKEMKLDKTEL